MSKPIIQVENLGKSYALGSKEPKHRTLQEAITGAIRSPGKRLRELRGKAEDAESEFWALRDVSFNIERGEVVGVIGRNGAGKSTLLKILSRITEPTTGRAILRGRVASLLEVGTGFHAELSGRENIYLNGSILGLTKKEIDRKFDEIVDFAEVEKFLDTPVKRYSSGMYVRLAFAVAAHLEPEILIVDEVLAVGDAQFQEKCIGKMRDVSRGEGRTVLLVSHNIGIVEKLCHRIIVMQKGSVVVAGTPSETLPYYFSALTNSANTDINLRSDRGGSGGMKITKIETSSSKGCSITTGCKFEITFYSNMKIAGAVCSFDIFTREGIHVSHFNSCETAPNDIRTSDPLFTCRIDELPLPQGRYFINVSLLVFGELHDSVDSAYEFEVQPGMVYGRSSPNHARCGIAIIPHTWST